MEVGIVGPPLTGKSTLFSLLVGSHGLKGEGGSRVGVVAVPDSRLDALAGVFKPRKVTHATVSYVDVPGLSSGDAGGSLKLNLPALRQVDCLMVVLRGFSLPGADVSDPLSQLADVQSELLIADQLSVEKRLEKVEKDLRKRKDKELEAEHAALAKCLEALEAEKPLRDAGLSEDERRMLRGFGFLTLKPMLVVVNVDEGSLGEWTADGEDWELWLGSSDVALEVVSARLEKELLELGDDEDARALMEEYGIERSPVERLIEASYKLLGLISFFTVGDKECRAWPLKSGATALDAAGTVHTDMARGFIRAEVVRWDQLVKAGSFAACRESGVLRLEGKGYRVQDGDVIHFRFSK